MCCLAEMKIVIKKKKIQKKQLICKKLMPPRNTRSILLREAWNTGHPALAMIGQWNKTCWDDSPPCDSTAQWIDHEEETHVQHVSCVYVHDWYSLRLCGYISLWNKSCPCGEHLWGFLSRCGLPSAPQLIWSFWNKKTLIWFYME